jgi:hypothetical protein
MSDSEACGPLHVIIGYKGMSLLPGDKWRVVVLSDKITAIGCGVPSLDANAA